MSGSQVLQLSAAQPRTLAYAQNIRKDLQLLEVDESLLQELLRDGLCVKGAPDEEAVLCSGSKTFAVKKVETTNLVLLVQGQQQPRPGDGPLGSQDLNLPQPTPPGQLLGLASQLAKNAAAAAHTPVIAQALVSSHLELVPAAPRLHQLDVLLLQRQYGAEGGPQEQPGRGTLRGATADAAEDDMQTDSDQQPGSASGSGSGSFCGGHTEEELLGRVQCSAGELRAALADRKALCLGGRYCIVDPSYQGMLLELVLLTAVEHGWPLSQLPGSRVAAALEPHGYDPRVTLHCLASFGSCIHDSSSRGAEHPSQAGSGDASEPSAMDLEGPSPPTGQDDGAAGAAEEGGSSGGGTFALDETAVCLHFARSLLQARPDWELAEFEAEWQRAVPEGMLPALEMLRGEALLHGGGTGPSGVAAPRRIKHFPLSALPADAPSRFAALFAERPRWEWDDLAPYVQSLRGPGQTAEALLLKYARASQQRPTDPVTYSMR